MVWLGFWECKRLVQLYHDTNGSIVGSIPTIPTIFNKTKKIMKYRIIEVELYYGVRYYIQKTFLWWWCTLDRYGTSNYSPYSYKDLDDAKEKLEEFTFKSKSKIIYEVE